MAPMDLGVRPMSRKSVLFVCMANICRSPALEASLRHLAAQKKRPLHVDSCGIGWIHLGEHPDSRIFETAKAKGILIDHRAQQFQDHFFEEFDYIFTVDQEISEQLKLRALHPEHKAKIRLVTAFSQKHKDQEIPDPYYMGQSGFNEVMEMILESCDGILRHIYG